MERTKKRKKIQPETIKKAKNFLIFLKPYSGTYAIGFVFLILSSIVSISIPYLLGKLLGMNPADVKNEWHFFDYKSIYGVLSIIAVALPIQAFLSFFRIYLFSVVTQKTLKDIRVIAFNSLIKAPMAFFDQNKTGELSSRISADANLIQETLTTTVAEFLRQIITIIIALSLVIYTSHQLALTMITVIPVVAILAVFFGKFIKGLSKKTQDEAATSNNILEEALISIRSLKAFTNEYFESKRYSNSAEKIQTIALKAALWRGLFVGFVLIILFGSVVFIIWRGIELVNLGPENGGINSESFFQFIMMTVMIGASIGSVPELLSKIQNALGATESLMDIINNESEKVDMNEQIIGNKNLKGVVTFNNLSFSYPSRKDVQVIKNISLEIKAGEQLAIVGASGGGKTTLASLILQFYQPDSGNILFDGKNANEYSLSELRSQMALVPQEVILLGGTIEENILYGKPNSSTEEVISAAKKANAYDFIKNFPDGLNTIVGDRGIQLSGGQRQRIAIARAILRNPSILILDEATSALDSESETLVQDALNKLMENRTSIVIAHRLSTIKNADKIIVIENGEITESGSPEELLKNENGVFYRLKQLQKD